jgi:hypothetical protein
MAPAILDFEDLRRVSRLGPRATLARVERWAAQAGIRYRYDGRGGIWTTLDAMNAALGLGDAPQQGSAERYDPSMVA